MSVAMVWLAGCAPARSYSGKLRHVVLFKWKDEASAADVKAIEDAIADFPPTMPMITGLEWGKDVSVEELADGFTHCYLISFEDADGLKAYLPHPTHQAGVKKLKPAMEKLLVFDYIAGDAVPPMAPIVTAGKLRHVVMFQFKEGTTAEQVKAIEDKFRSLPARIPEIKAFEWGTVVGGRGANAGFTHCFLVTFDDAAGRKIYLPHPAHKEFVKLVGPSVKKVLVIDYIADDAM